MPPKKATTTVAKAAPTTASTTIKRRAEDEADDAPTSKRGRPTQGAAAAKKDAVPRKATTKADGLKRTSTVTKKTVANKPATKKTAAPKASVKTPAKAPVKAPARARKVTDLVVEINATQDAPTGAAKTNKAAPVKKTKVLPEINKVSTQRLNVYVFGEGDMGELGLGSGKGVKNVKRPRLNPHLAADQVGVVQVAVGGMHVVALTADNKIVTWGVNDQGACGRDTTWDGGLKDMDADDSDDSDAEDSGLNPKEATPTAIPSRAFPEGTRFVQVAAGDSISFALTVDGSVYGWGTFRSNEGVLGFTADIEVQRSPMLVPGLSKIQEIECGANHVLALDAAGSVFAWGSGQQNQLGRRVVERTRMAGLTPREFGLPKKKVKIIGVGAYHSFAVDSRDNVWAWGLNSFGECGIADNAGESEACVAKPTKVASLCGKRLAMIKGGAHHSVAVTEDGDCLVWGRTDSGQTGMDLKTLPEEDVRKDDKGNPRILLNPTKIPDIKCSFVTAESDHSIAITTDGQAYSWGFSANYQTGQGTDDDVNIATLIDNTAVRGKKLNWAGAGGQFSVLTGIAETTTVNGHGGA